jgi:hypothetical protein
MATTTNGRRETHRSPCAVGGMVSVWLFAASGE